jgi:hypothetical protein
MPQLQIKKATLRWPFNDLKIVYRYDLNDQAVDQEPVSVPLASTALTLQ